MVKRILLFVAASLFYVVMTGYVVNGSELQKADKAHESGHGLTTQKQNHAADRNTMHKSQQLKRLDGQRNNVNNKKKIQPVLDAKSADLLVELLVAGE